ncbi:MAG: hypothetical protein M3O34_07550 [Chloroflexota bacterium]|nr:hypothetical protein [Chloroflexota bacterium]
MLERVQFGAGVGRVLRLVATGMTTDEVVACLAVSPDEVRRDVAHAIDALGARSKLEAVVIALRLGLVDLPKA